MNQNNPGTGKISLIIASMMLVVYLGLGYLFIATPMWTDRFPRPNRIYIGLVLVGWAIFRGFMVWQRYKRMKQDDENQ
ncbi:hypothetical protein BH11BAC7_BH11BAC7_01750 [soil metagenome]